MKLSIIVPVYNMAGGGKLNYCVDSLLKQTISDYEIILVDDASTDETPKILAKYYEEHPEKIIINRLPRNMRQGGARNLGLKLARGEWISFVDGDDWIREDFCEKLLKKAEETGADIVGCDYNLVTEHTMEVGKVVQNNTLDQTGVLTIEKHKKLILRPGSMVIKIYKKSVIVENELSFPEEIFYEDNCAGPLWSLYFKHFEKVEEPMYYYYQHDSSTVHGITEEKCYDRMKAGELFYEGCKKRNLLEEYEKEIEYRFSELYYCNTLFTYMQGVKSPKYTFVKKLRKETEKKFKEFRKNEYYLQFTGLAEQKLIKLQEKSDILFFIYYRLQLFSRKLRKNGKGIS
ncbi:glycosyltransferase [Lachnospiraceae bacterium OttesenSCG-928-D06]|nr:glycosyltransferase [Lachnospiraceae bacterium OttesenSCG-928-D06]